MMMPIPFEEFSLRFATTADIDDILILQRATPECAQWPRASYEEILLAPAQEDSSLLRMVVCVLYLDRVVGFLVGSRLRLAETTECELENMAVSSSHRQCGLGQRLVEALLDWCHEQLAERIHLEVRASNIAALALYAKMGFSLVGRRQAYYSQPVEDAILMAWKNNAIR